MSETHRSQCAAHDTGQVAKVPPMTSLEARGLGPKGGDEREILMALESHTGLSQEQGDLGAPGHGANDWPVRGNHPSSHGLPAPVGSPACFPTLLENTDSQKIAANAPSSLIISQLVDPFKRSFLQAFVHLSRVD